MNAFILLSWGDKLDLLLYVIYFQDCMDVVVYRKDNVPQTVHAYKLVIQITITVKENESTTYNNNQNEPLNTGE